CSSSGGCGTVFKIARSGAETMLHSFAGGSGDGEEPNAGLININGTLYGTTAFGGANGDGTVFSLAP
ncbi:MAG: choice-of-anchor tandem repeat GloVer-containing protein, partial [Candidatus Cybelea sp.]